MLIDAQGIERVSKETVDKFSPMDWLSWIQEATCLISSDWEMRKGIDLSSVENCEEWQSEIDGLSSKLVL